MDQKCTNTTPLLIIMQAMDHSSSLLLCNEVDQMECDYNQSSDYN